MLGERLVAVSLPMPDLAELPDTGFQWQEQWAVNMKCISGADAGTEVVFKPTTVGGIQAIAGLIDDGARPPQRRPARRQGLPIVLLEKDSLPASAVREDLDAAADDRRLDAA